MALLFFFPPLFSSQSHPVTERRETGIKERDGNSELIIELLCRSNAQWSSASWSPSIINDRMLIWWGRILYKFSPREISPGLLLPPFFCSASPPPREGVIWFFLSGQPDSVGYNSDAFRLTETFCIFLAWNEKFYRDRYYSRGNEDEEISLPFYSFTFDWGSWNFGVNHISECNTGRRSRFSLIWRCCRCLGVLRRTTSLTNSSQTPGDLLLSVISVPWNIQTRFHINSVSNTPVFIFLWRSSLNPTVWYVCSFLKAKRAGGVVKGALGCYT